MNRRYGAAVRLEVHDDCPEEMVELVALFNLEQSLQHKVEIQICVGIASGQMIAGYTGTQTRATYTCVGDTVNRAARLEDYTKVAGQPILIDEDTCSGLGDEIAVEEQGLVKLQGIAQSLPIFSVAKK